ncbi:protein C10-like [Watersipora subatra]|uniref:protein C10-like n=1 Tax=Watersipora subatra TaxID=2589382 RepID=UPI00355B891C
MLSNMSMTINEAKDILGEILDSLSAEDSAFRAARAEAGTDMLNYLRVVFPLATETQMHILENHGHTEQGEDLVRFTRLVKELEKQDEELSHLYHKLKKLLIPTKEMVSVKITEPDC